MAAPSPGTSTPTSTGWIPRQEYGAGSTPTPSHRDQDGVGDGFQTDGLWDADFETASAGHLSSSEEDVRQNRERIHAQLYAEQEARHQREQAVRQLPPVTEEDAAQADTGATAAPGVAETQQPASAPEILKITDPLLRVIPHDPVRAEESRRRFLMNEQSFGAQDRCAGATTAERGRQTW